MVLEACGYRIFVLGPSTSFKNAKIAILKLMDGPFLFLKLMDGPFSFLIPHFHFGVIHKLQKRKNLVAEIAAAVVSVFKH